MSRTGQARWFRTVDTHSFGGSAQACRASWTPDRIASHRSRRSYSLKTSGPSLIPNSIAKECAGRPSSHDCTLTIFSRTRCRWSFPLTRTRKAAWPRTTSTVGPSPLWSSGIAVTSDEFRAIGLPDDLSHTGSLGRTYEPSRPILPLSEEDGRPAASRADWRILVSQDERNVIALEVRAHFTTRRQETTLLASP